MRPSRPLPRTLAVFGAGLAASALVLAGCGTSSSSSADSGAPGPGVTDTTVKIGFITLKPSTAGGGSGFNVPDYGDAKKQVAAVVDAVNKSGGIAGRKVTPVVKVFDASTDSVQTETDLCTAFTQDEKVFAVVTVGQREASGRTCYQKASTMMFDAGGVAQAQQTYEALKPYFWAPSAPALEPYARGQMEVLKNTGFLTKDSKVGTLIENSPAYEDVYKTVVKPALDAAGVASAETAVFDASSNDTLGSSSGTAVNQFKASGVNKVIFLGRGDMVGFFTSISPAQQYAPRLAIGTYEGPGFAAANPAFYPAAQMKDSVGIGFSGSVDGINTDFPDAGAEGDAIDMFKAAGITFANRPDARRALGYYDAIDFLRVTGEKIGKDGTLNAAGVATAAAALGTSWQSAVSAQTTFGPNIYAGGSGGRPMKYDNATGKFVYTGDVKTFPTQ